MNHCAAWIAKSLTIAACASMLGLSCSAQATRPVTDVPDSHVDFYAGYGYFQPIDSGINGFTYQKIDNFNATSNLSFYFNHYLGFQLEGVYFSGNSPRGSFGQCRGPFPGACNDRDPLVYSAEAGPVMRFPHGRWIPYTHALFGGAKINGPILQKLTWGYGLTLGGGVDYVLPYYHNRFAIRPIQADFQYSHVDYGPLQPDGIEGGVGNIKNIKLSAGLVVRFGAPSENRPVEFGCTVEPASVFPGEPVVINGSIVNLKPNHHPVFTWTTSGGRITPNDSSATINTTGLAPGNYTAAGHLSYGKKASEQAQCSGPFTVKAYDPPTVTCSASPSTVTSGGTVNISASGISPQNRPLTYSYAATGGQITGSGSSATLATAGLATSTVTVTCNVVDDLGQTASASTMVSVQKEIIPPPPLPQQSSLCPLSFERDKRQPARVDNAAKACLDDIALSLQKNSDAQLYIVANRAPAESAQVAGERALNARQYLTQAKGVETGRIFVRTGDTSGKTANTVLVPAGATFTTPGTQTIDESSIKRHGQPYGVGDKDDRGVEKHKHHRAEHTTDPRPDLNPK
jgi:hypothetical protein